MHKKSIKPGRDFTRALIGSEEAGLEEADLLAKIDDELRPQGKKNLSKSASEPLQTFGSRRKKFGSDGEEVD